MKFNAVKNKYEFKEGTKTFKGWRVNNETEHEVVLDIVLNRGEVVVTIKKVFID